MLSCAIRKRSPGKKAPYHFVFAALIAIAGCQAGMQSGRSADAVGRATTRAVVNAIVYLVVADAALNIVYDKLHF